VTSIEKVWHAIGGRKVFSKKPASFVDLLPLARAGFPFAALEATAIALGRSLDATAEVINIPRRTMYLRKEQRRLHPDESDRVLRLALALTEAEETLGSREKATRWLARPNRALGGESPEALLATEYGARLVRDELNRIEHGVFA
jgi:putative toxin-antitoxin system antitoxin component (TIGR02293 family)